MIEDFLSALIPSGTRSLHTKKIDGNIQSLIAYTWFKELYENEKYERLFLTNRNIRSYLQSTRRVKKIIKHATSREKFIELLDEQIK